MQAHTSNKSFESSDHRQKLIIQALTKQISVNSVSLEVNERVFSWNFEFPEMFTFIRDGFVVIHLSVCQQNVFRAWSIIPFALSCGLNLENVLVRLIKHKLHIDLFEAISLERNGAVFIWIQVACINRCK